MTDMSDSRHIDRLRLLFPLADALAMPLQLRKSGRITGQQMFAVEVGDSSIEFTAKVFAYTLTKDASAVLVKVRKRLWLYLNYDRQTTRLTLLIADAAPANFHENETTEKNISGLSLDQFMAKHANAVKACFTRLKDEKGWTDGHIPVDTRQKKATGKGAAVPD